MLSCSLTFSHAVRKANKTAAIDIIQASSYRAVNFFLTRAIPIVVRISSFEPLLRKAYEKPLTVAQRMAEWFEAKAIIRAHAVFGPSQLIADYIQKTLKINVKIIETSFLLETLEFDTKPYLNNFEGKQYLLFFGTIGLLKGCKTIADILHLLFLQNPGLFFAFIGREESYQNRPMSEYIYRSAGDFHNRVLILPPLKHEALYPIIQHAKGIILPSRIDNFPNTCLEAMHFGQIVVGTQEAGFEQIIDNEKSGFLCAADDGKSLLGTINKVLTLAPEKRTAMSENARKRIAMLAPCIITQQLAAFYEGVIKSFQQPGGEHR
jgi:Glycosyltransferase